MKKILYLIPIFFLICNSAFATNSLINSGIPFFSVANLGAIGDGITDNTVIFQSAENLLPSTGGIIYVPAGTYILSTINITKPTIFIGEGGSYSGGTILQEANATGDMFYVTSTGFSIHDFLFKNSVTRTAGAYIHGVNVGSFTVRDVVMEGHYQGINVDGGTGILIENSQFYKATPATTSAGSGSIFLGQNNYTGGVNVNNCLINSSPAGYASYGIWVGYVDVMSMVGDLIIESGDNLHISPGAGQFTALLSVVDCVFDTSTYGAVLLPLGSGNITRLTFSGCWFSVMSQNGILMDGQYGTIQGVTINKSYIMNNSVDGINIDGVTGTAGNIRDILIDGNFIASNTSTGIQVLDNPVNISIINNSIGAYAGGSGNGVGIIMDSTPTGKITGNNFTGNTTNISGTPAGIVYFENIGLVGIGTWTTYTPTVASTSGTLTTKSATGAYIQQGKTVTFEINATITTNGTGSGAINLGLPSGITAATASIFSGRGAAVSSKMLQGIVSANGSIITVFNYDGTYPASSGENLIISGTFQSN